MGLTIPCVTCTKTRVHTMHGKIHEPPTLLFSVTAAAQIGVFLRCVSYSLVRRKDGPSEETWSSLHTRSTLHPPNCQGTLPGNPQCLCLGESGLPLTPATATKEVATGNPFWQLNCPQSQVEDVTAGRLAEPPTPCNSPKTHRRRGGGRGFPESSHWQDLPPVCQERLGCLLLGFR